MAKQNKQVKQMNDNTVLIALSVAALAIATMFIAPMLGTLSVLVF